MENSESPGVPQVMGVARQQGYNTKLVEVKNLLYALSYAPENSERIYYFLLLDPEKEEGFRKALAGVATFNIKDYATVIAAGYGDPPEDIKEQMLIKYNAIL
jgi:hypothetical protein